MSARKSSHRTIFLIVSSGSPLALIASSLRSTSKKPVCPMTRSLHPPMAHCGQRVRFAATWREEFFEVPLNQADLPVASSPWSGCVGRACTGFLLVEHDELLAAHFGVALQHVHIAGEGRHLVLLTNLQRRCSNLHGFVAVPRKALQRVWRARIFPCDRVGGADRGGSVVLAISVEKDGN